MKFAMVKQLIQEVNLYFLTIKTEKRYWIIEISQPVRGRGSKDIYLHNDKGEVRKFKTLDAAHNVCKALGRKDVGIKG